MTAFRNGNERMRTSQNSYKQGQGQKENTELLYAFENKDGCERIICFSIVLEGTILAEKKQKTEDKARPTRTSVAPKGLAGSQPP